MKTLTKKEKSIWNEAVKKTCNELKLWDGLIPDADDRNRLAAVLKEKVSYKLKTKSPK